MPQIKAKGERAQSLNVFLLLRPVKTIAEEIRKTKPSIEERRVIDSGRDLGILFAANFPDREPSWFKFFDAKLDKDLKIKNRGSGAVLLMQMKGNSYAIYFGYGKSILPDDCWANDFGLIVTLNSIDSSKIRQVDHLSLAVRGRHTKTQMGQAAPLTESGVDLDQDLVREIVGTPTIEDFGKRLSGTDQVKLTPKVSIENLPGILDQLHTKYQDKTYVERFPWVNRFREIESTSEINRLDGILVENIKKNRLERTWMAVPEVVDWDQVTYFTYRGGSSEDHYEDIFLEKFLETILDKSLLTVDYLKRRKIIGFDHQEVPIYFWTSYRCLYSEVDGQNEIFILSGGSWYKVENDFADSVTKFMEGVEYSDISFPWYMAESEAKYNEDLCNDKKAFALMDRKNIKLKGYDSIEFCDLYSTDKKIIHVKHYRGSDGLSHLFMQGSNSATLFLSLPEFREKVNEFLPATHKLANTDKKPNSNDFTIIFAIISSDPSPKLKLPFFSRITFRKVHQELVNYGFSVKLAKIQNRKAKAT